MVQSNLPRQVTSFIQDKLFRRLGDIYLGPV